MPYLLILTIGLVAMVFMFAAIWLLQRRIENAGIVDVFWGPAVAVVGVFYCIALDGLLERRWLVGFMIAAWACRLSWHLWTRHKSSDEDERYTQLKQHWGESAQRRMFRFYQMQGCGAFLFSLAVFLSAKNQMPMSISDVIGLIVWLAAVIGESMSDYQLHSFKHAPENKGKVCKNGWWRYSRHPNYFFEFLHWCCFGTISRRTKLRPPASTLRKPHSRRQPAQQHRQTNSHQNDRTHAFLYLIPHTRFIDQSNPLRSP